MVEELRFEEWLGKVRFVYTEEIDHSSCRRINEEIPEEVVGQGQEAIKNYASVKINQAKRKWEKFNAVEEDIKTNHIPIKTKYKDGTVLEGRIVEATSRFVSVKLDKPILVEEERRINFGFASAMSGHHVFDEGHKISKYGYDAAYNALCYSYMAALNKPVKDLVKKLNSEN